MATPAPFLDRPLCVDLDGTLIRNDLFWESLLLLLRQRPFLLFALPLQLIRGRAALKRYVAARVDLDTSTFVFHEPFVAWLNGEKAKGRRLILATGSDERLARQAAAACGLFDEVIATNGDCNLKGRTKLDVLRGRFQGGFDYAGNSPDDRPIWEGAARAIAVNASRSIEGELSAQSKLEIAFSTPRPTLSLWMKALRAHQWSKNLLVFVAAFTGHQIHVFQVLGRLTVLFLVLSLCASGLYLLNDLLDLVADRKHAHKRLRPFACGDLPVMHGVIAIPILLALSCAIALITDPRMLVLMLVYAAGSILYSTWLKTKAPMDVFVLTGLYVLRIIAGGVAAHIPVTIWLFSFSIFFFLSLACCKRVSELILLRRNGVLRSIGRGYGDTDLEQMNTFGVAAAFASSVVLALYLNSEQVRRLYDQPLCLAVLIPMFLYWQARAWTITWRGGMHDDPVVFAIKDPLTYVFAVAIGLLMLIAKFDLLKGIVVFA